MPHRLVFDLLITRKGDYWVATSNGIARFNPLAATSNTKFRAHVPPPRPTSETILDLYEDSSGTIWAGTGNGLFRLHETGNDVQLEFVSLGEKSNEELEIGAIVEDLPGVLWIGTETGLFRRYADGKAELVFSIDGPYLSISIKDDGKGFKPAQNGNLPGMGGHGLVNTSRIRSSVILTGACTWNSALPVVCWPAIRYCVQTKTASTVRRWSGGQWRFDRTHAFRKQ